MVTAPPRREAAAGTEGGDRTALQEPPPDSDSSESESDQDMAQDKDPLPEILEEYNAKGYKESHTTWAGLYELAPY